MPLTKALGGSGGGGGSGTLTTVKDEGTNLSAAVTSLDFVGAGVTATNVGTAVTVTIPGASTPAEVLIAETVVGVGGVASVSFTSIAATYRDLRLVVRGRGTKAATLTTITMRVNNDSTAIYDYQRFELNNNTTSNAGFVAQSSWQIGYLPAANAAAGVASFADVRLFDYRGTAFHKHMSAANGVKFSTGAPGAGDLALDRFAGFWRSTSAINRVDVFCDTGNFAESSVVSLYGIL